MSRIAVSSLCCTRSISESHHGVIIVLDTLTEMERVVGTEILIELDIRMISRAELEPLLRWGREGETGGKAGGAEAHSLVFFAAESFGA